MTATSSGMAEFYAGCATAEEMLLVPSFFGPLSRGGALHGPRGSTGNLHARRRREGQGVRGANLVATASGQAKTLMLQTVKSVDNCADLETKRWCGWYVERT